MKKFTIKNIKKISIFSALFLLLGLNTAQNVPVTITDPLGRALQATGAELDKAYITGKVSVELQENNPLALAKIVGDISRAMKIDTAAAVIEEQNSDYQKCLKLSYHDEKRQVVISVCRVNEKNKQSEIIIHNVQKNPLYTDIMAVRNNISEILQNFNQTPLITTCLEGYLDGKLRKGEWEFCLRDSFAAIDAKIISGLCNEYYASYIGYSKALPEKITVDKQYVNFNIAMRYHEFDDRTYVIIGSPLITIDY